MKAEQVSKFIRSLNLGLGVVLTSLFIFSDSAFAANAGVTYQGRILKPNGEPLSGRFTQFRMQIRTPDSQQCLMYEEGQTLDMRTTNGSFSITINDGRGSRLDTTALSLDRIFANRGTFTLDSATCSSGAGSYTPNASDGRALTVLFRDETMSAWEPIPPQMINYVPFAFEAKQVSGFGADSLLRVINSAGDPITNLSPLSNAEYTELLALANGSSTQFEKAGKLAGTTLPTLGVAQAGQALTWNGTGWATASTAVGADAISSSNIVNGTITGSDLATNIAIATSGVIATSSTVTATGNVTSGGSVSAATSVIAPQIYGSTAASGNIRIDGTSDVAKGNVLLASAGGNVGIGTSAPASRLQIGENSGATLLPSVVSIETTTPSNLTAAFQIGTANKTPPALVVTNTGNVGINAAPNTNALLHVANSASSPIRISRADDINQKSSISYYPETVSASTPAWASGMDKNQSGFSVSSYDGSTTSTRLFIDAQGKVGIGTAAPGAGLKVDVNGILNATGLRINGTSIVQGGANQSATGAFTFTSDSDSSGNDGGFILKAGSSARLSINHQGQATFHNSFTSNFSPTNQAIYTPGGIGADGYILAGSALVSLNGQVFSRAANTTTYSSPGTTDVPTGPELRVQNDSQADGVGAFVRLQTTNSTSVSQKAYVGAISKAGSAYSPAVVFGQQTDLATFAERMRIDSNGSVGIGTSTPQATLDLNGDIRLKKNSAEPVACSSTYDGRVSLTSQYTLCVCKGSTATWVRSSDGTTACSW